MLRLRYAFRDDATTIASLSLGENATCPISQIITFRKREISPDFLDEYLALDPRSSAYLSSAYTEYGKKLTLNKNYRKCVAKIESQIEFTVKPRLFQKLEEFLPVYTASSLYDFFDGQPYGYLVVLRVFSTDTVIPESLMYRGRKGSAQIIQLYDEYGDTTHIDIAGDLVPVVEPGVFQYINDEIIHTLRLENALLGVYGSDEDSKRLLRQKRDAFNENAGVHRWEYDENEDIDRSITDYSSIYSQIVTLDESLKPFVEYVSGIKAPQMVEWQALMARIKEGDDASRSRLVEMYLRNVLRIALSYSQRFALPIADVIQDGIMGLLTAIEKFDSSGIETFQTYFPFWVRQNIQREMPKYMYQRYFPIHAHEKMIAIMNIASEFEVNLPDDYLDCESIIHPVMERLDLDESTTRKYISFFAPWVSLDETLSNADDNDFNNDNSLLTNTDYDVNFEALYYQQLRIALDKCLDTLTERESMVIRQRYGLDDGQFRTLEEIGSELGVTRERIRQIEAKALRKLRHPSRSKRLKEYL